MTRRANGQLPSRRPERTRIAGEDYRVTLLYVKSRDRSGRPLLCEVIYEERQLNVDADADCFLLVYFREDQR